MIEDFKSKNSNIRLDFTSHCGGGVYPSPLACRWFRYAQQHVKHAMVTDRFGHGLGAEATSLRREPRLVEGVRSLASAWRKVGTTAHLSWARPRQHCAKSERLLVSSSRVLQRESTRRPMSESRAFRTWERGTTHEMSNEMLLSTSSYSSKNWSTSIARASEQ